MKLLTFFCLLLISCTSPLSARSNNRKIIVMENKFIQKNVLLSKGKIFPLSYENKRIASHSRLPVLKGTSGSEEFVIVIDSVHAIKASDLICSKIQRINQKKQEVFIFQFVPYTYQQVQWTITLKYVIDKGDPYCLKKSLSIKVPRTQWKLSKIDYIDIFHFSTTHAMHDWTLPHMQDGAEGVNGYYLSLGQPFYVNGMFWGCEFPATDNKIEHHQASVRYFLGKNMSQLNEDHRLNADGTFVTWNGVVGATESATDMDVIQNGFFAYIRKIAVPTNLRIQYNSWYDFRLDITNDNILQSFREIEKNLTQNGVPPLDSYAIDDGWNAYGPWEKSNKSHFWEFNQKFPNGLTEPARYAESVASHLGLWLGPRGGYDFNVEFAKMLEKYGNGVFNVHSNDIVTGDKVYLKKLQEFFLRCQHLYHINYWKLDGFLHTPPQPGPDHRYITGGYRGMYYVTEHWERWIRIFQALRRANPRIWLNLTSYVNPSPWFLQWGNSVWLQNSSDLGRVNTGLSKDVDQMLTYRDGRYFDFIRTRQFQFPIDHLYNHDPIFGKANSRLTVHSLSDEDFRLYLSMMMTRGNSFWELYYSTQLFDSAKWLVNAQVLGMLRQKHALLVHAKMFGGNPVKGAIYGYSSWNGNQGMISIRNPSSEQKDYTLILDNRIGMDQGLSRLHGVTLLSENSSVGGAADRLFAYGDTLHLQMNPGEARLWEFSTVPDTVAPTVVFAKVIAPQRIRIHFNEPVRLDPDAAYSMTHLGKKQTPWTSGTVQLLTDRQTLEIPFSPASIHPDSLRIHLIGVEDLSGNKLQQVVPLTFFPDAVVYDSKGNGGPMDAKVYGTHSDFSVVCSLNPSAMDVSDLFSIGQQVDLKLLNSGKLVFRVGDLKVESQTSLLDGRKHIVIAVREMNGMLKIYLDGNIDASVYNPRILLPEVRSARLVMNRSAVDRLQLLDRALPYNECLHLGLRKLSKGI